MADQPSKIDNASRPGYREFVFLMASMVALDAFSIDAMLPALGDIGDQLAVANSNHRQFVITALFLGFSFGVLFYGFLADSFGRRKPVIAGFILYITGSLICILAASFEQLLAGRAMQGLGAAGPYVLSVAIVRDRYQGREMAKILSLIMMVFIGVPMIAPFVGQGILMIAGWRSIFAVLTAFALTIMAWFWIRQPETLQPQNRQEISIASILAAVTAVMTTAQSLRYLIALGAVTGAFIAYLSTGQQVFQDIYLLGGWFPLVFALLASLFGIGSWFNARWVETAGSERLVHYALTAIVASSLIYSLTMLVVTHSPPLWSYLAYMSLVMFAFAFLFGNITSLALEPLGHIAGSASSLVNAISTAMAIVLATLVGTFLRDSVLPVVAGFGVCCLVAGCLNYFQLAAGRRSIQ